MQPNIESAGLNESIPMLHIITLELFMNVLVRLERRKNIMQKAEIMPRR